MVQSITEREKGTPSDSEAADAVRAIVDGPAAAPAKAAAAHAPTNSRLRTLFSQKFPADIFYAENAFESDVHVSLDDRFPEAGAVAVAHGAEGFGGGVEIGLFEGEIQD